MSPRMLRYAAFREHSLLALLCSLGLALPLAGTGWAAAELPASRLRIRIADGGIYEFSRSDLVRAGVPVSDPGFDPRTLRLAFDAWKPVALLADSTPASWQADWEMQETSIWVPGEEDGRLDPGDRVVFYALGPAGYDDLAAAGADSLAHSQHPYDRFNYGWLVWGGAPGQRMEAIPAAAPEPLADPLVTRAWHREHLEQDRFFTHVGDLLGWERLSPGVPTRIEFDLDLGGEAAAAGTLHLQLGNTGWGASGGVDVRLNGVFLGHAVAPMPGGASRVALAASLLQAHDTLFLEELAGQSTGSRIEFFEIDGAWERLLAADARLELQWSARPATAAQVYELQGFGATQPLLLDVTDARRPARLLDLTSVDAMRWRARHGRGAGRRVHYLAAAAPRHLDPVADLDLRTVAPLRARASCPDMLIVVHPDLLAAAERLAAHRRQHFPGISNPDVLVATTQDIYDNFSGGRMDPLAIRNHVKFLGSLSTEPRPAYLLLFGDATHDPRQVLAGSPPTLVPTVHPGYVDERFRQAYAVEDWLGETQTPRAGTAHRPAPQPDLSIGRLPAQDLAEAERMVDKIVAYETSNDFGAWRGRVLFAADDECNPIGGCGEAFFTHNSEELARRTPAELDMTKIYLTEYPLAGTEKPAARSAFLRAWSEGCALVSYQGHGSSLQLADEVLFLTSDVQALRNGVRLPLVLAFHDGEAEFDHPTRRTLHELLVASPDGGAIAAIGTTSVTYVGPGYQLALGQFAELFRDGATTQQPIGLVHRRSKPATDLAPFLEHYVLLGDPACILQLPRAVVEFTTGADSLVAGRREHVEGFVHLPGETRPLADFDGIAEVEVLGNADDSGYERTTPPIVRIPYVLPGAPIYRGRVPVTGGRFAFEFTVPPLSDAANPSAQRLRLGPGGRVAATAWTATLDAKGGRDGIVFLAGAGQDSSLAPPRIRLGFAAGATRVGPGARLAAEIRDENGVWIAGTTPASTILLAYDGGEPLDVTSSYRAEAGSDTSGTLAVTIPELAPGMHRATLAASDNLGNAASGSVDFEVLEAPVVRLSSVRVIPNPAHAGAQVSFLLDVPAEITLRVFTVAGREVWRAHQRHDGGRRGLVVWDGSDPGGRPVANGVYLYTLSARPAGTGSAPQQHAGKLVVLRD